jgi:Zn-dependent protease with chaperone function
MPLPDSSSTANARAVAELEAGLAAFKQGDYARAIALLKANTLPPTHPLSLKAQMGLVIAYTKVKQPQQAIALCQALCQSPHPQTQAWATETLAGLQRRYPQLQQSEANPAIDSLRDGKAERSGFVPLDSVQPAEDVLSDRTGFTPIEPEVPSSQSPETETGCTPLEPPVPSCRQVAPAPTSSDRRKGTSAPQPHRSDVLASPAASQFLVEQPAYEPTWRNAGRLTRGQSLGKLKVWRFVAVQVLTAIALFWMVQTIGFSAFDSFTTGLSRIPWLGFRKVLTEPPTIAIVVSLVILFVSSRWLLDALLKWRYGLQAFSMTQLHTYSEETVQLLRRFCQNRRIPPLSLGLLSATEPIVFSYGFLPRYTRIVVSQGLLDRLADDEIATLYANELGHLVYRDTPLMSLATVLTQIPYTLYAIVSEWGNRKTAKITQLSARLIAAASYGIYALLRWMALWLSRQRLYFSDRVATELTGNPNGYSRALLKLAIGTAQTVENQTRTSHLLEGFDLLTPLGQRMATSLGSLYPYTPLEPMLAWDWQHPLRHWLSLNNSHPPTGDRLHLLTLYARHWKLEPELQWSEGSQPVKRPRSLTAQQWQSLLLQGAPFFGIGLGLLMAFLFSLVGWAGVQLSLPQLAWMQVDRSLAWGLPLVGFSLGTFLRINPFFPDIKFFGTATAETSPSLPTLLKSPTAVPVDSSTVRLEGKLLGRSGISNDLSQDLLLRTTTGIVRLHCLSRWGPIGNLFRQDVRPTDLLNQTVVVTGWFRRGAVPWIDVETLRTTGGRQHRSNHPVWSVLLAAIAALLGIWTIAKGGIF